MIGEIVGGLLDFASAERGRDLTEKAYKNRIRWTVEDAQKAGVHPLFALGGGVGSSPTFQTGGTGFREAGAAVDRGMRQKKAEASENELHQATVDEIKSRTKLNEVEAADINSRAALEMSRLYSGGNDFFGVFGNPTSTVKRVPVEIPYARPGDPSKTPGQGPMWEDVVVTPEGDTITVPTQQQAEKLESAGPMVWPQLGGIYLKKAWRKYQKLVSRQERLTYQDFKAWWLSQGRSK